MDRHRPGLTLAPALVGALLAGTSCAGQGERLCAARPEECNAIDDDCDGEMDESESGGPLRRDCSNACGPGTEECSEGVWEHCSAPQPTEEACNGFDDDCDGSVDEDCTCEHGDTQPCGTDVGECDFGVARCEDGTWGDCQLGYDPADHPELCDDLDNDCDGQVDEGCSCTPGDERACGTDEGECETGTQSCLEGGTWDDECADGKEPEVDQCDGLDNDCDGEVDWIAWSGFGWRADRFETNDRCSDAHHFANVEKDGGWVSLPVSDSSSILSYATLMPGDEDWYVTRAVESANCFGWPWQEDDCFLLTVQLELLDRRYVEGVDQVPDDYRFCVTLGSCTDATDPERTFCTHMSNWQEDASSFLLGLTWGGSCSADHSRDVLIQVESLTGGGCGHYQLHTHFDATEC